jgi:hypothetical protein
MARNKIPDELITEEQRKKRERNEKYRLNKSKIGDQRTLKIVTSDLRSIQTERDARPQSQIPSQSQPPSIELFAKVSLLQQSFEEFSTKTMHHLDTLVSNLKREPDMSQSQIPPQSQPPSQSRIKEIETQWMSIFYSVLEPKGFCFVLLGLCLILLISGLTGYLMHQGFLFFASGEPDFTKALSSAIVSEAIPIICAGVFALTDSRRFKILSAIFLVTSIIGLGVFMKDGVVGNSLTQNFQYKAVQEERDLIHKSIETLNKSLAALPENYASKKEALRQEIETQRKNLLANTEASKNISGIVTQGTSAAVSYNVWIRIAAMLINAMLIHLLFTRIKSCLNSKQSCYIGS